MRTFQSDSPTLAVSHSALKAAAGSNQFVARFKAGSFSTDNEALADALAALVEAGNLRGVTETTPKPEAPKAPPVKEVADGPKQRRGK